MKKRLNKFRIAVNASMVGMMGEYLYRVECSIVPISLLVIMSSIVFVDIIINDKEK